MFAPGAALRVATNASDNASGVFSGTSYSAPLTTGVAATQLHHYGALDVVTLKSLIVSNASAGFMFSGTLNRSANLLLYSNIP